MPRTKRQKPLYQRGAFALHRRPGRTNLEIVWYDEERKRERSISAGTSDDTEGRKQLDRHYLKVNGAGRCPTCNRPWHGEAPPLIADAIADYLLLNEAKAGYRATHNRLARVVDYLVDKHPDASVLDIDQHWVDGFRKWLLTKPVYSPKGKYMRERSQGHVEGCVLQLAAVINALPGYNAPFRAEQPKQVSETPRYRASVKQIAAMFTFALAEPQRANLLRYLRMAVATWARPDAIFDVRADQWMPEAGVLDMNPKGRRQTKKYRPRVVVPKQFRPELDALEGAYIPVTLIRSSRDKMRVDVGLPINSETGPKLIRRSMATLGRKKLGEERWAQGQMMLGHIKASTSDIYALPDPRNLGAALAVTEEIIDEILAIEPAAYRTFTADQPAIKLVEGGRNG